MTDHSVSALVEDELAPLWLHILCKAPLNLFLMKMCCVNIVFMTYISYIFQLEQVEQTLQAAGNTEDLVTLRNDLLELIKLTEGKK